LDNRAAAQIEKYLYTGLIRIGQWNAVKMLRWLALTGGAAASVKDPLWKYLWLRENEPETFAAMSSWLDVKDALILRATGEVTMGYDSAHATFLFDTRPDKLRWHAGLCRTFDVDIRHLPRVIAATDVAGRLTAQAADEPGPCRGPAGHREGAATSRVISCRRGRLRRTRRAHLHRHVRVGRRPP
jgi:xylulokinase